jgi:hypothetical protein
MTTSARIRCNGNYVAQAFDMNKTLLGSAGPGSNVESEWINVGHNGFYVTERPATEEEIAAANALTEGEQTEEQTSGGD